jgi:hypothetical protein
MKLKIFKDKTYIVAFAIEIVGISIVSSGIYYEYISGEPIGFIIITTGSVIIATGSLLYAKIYKRLKHIK